jgi:hypothetical protein
MTDEQKAKIPPINRLHSTMTAAEIDYMNLMARGMRGEDVIGTPEYIAVEKALEEERE